MRPADRRAGGRPSLVAARVATCVFFALNGFALSMWVVHIPVVEADTHVSHGTLGALLLVFGASALAGMQLTGPLADRLGHRVVVPAAGVLLSAALVGPGLADGAWSLAVALLLLGFGNGSMDVSMNAHAVEVQRRYGRPVMSSFHAVFSLGGVAAAALGAPLLAHHVPQRGTLGVVGAVCLVVAVVAGRFLLTADRAAAAPAGPAGRPRAGTRAPARLVWLLGGLAFALMLAEGVAYDWAAVDLRDVLHQPASTAALAYGAFAVAMTAGRLAADRVVARLGPVRVVRYGAGLAALGLSLAAMSPVVALALAGWALFGVGLSGCVPQFFTAAGNLDARASGTVLSRVVGLGYLGILAGPASIGALSRWVPLNAAFALPVVLCVLGAAGAAAVGRRPAPADEPDTGPVERSGSGHCSACTTTTPTTAGRSWRTWTRPRCRRRCGPTGTR